MSIKRKKAEQKTAKKSALITKSVGNYEKHPFFVKKANAAKAFLQRVGLPDSLEFKKS